MFAYVESFPTMPREMPNPYSLPEIAKRLKLLRSSLNNTQATMANLAGVTPQAWGNYEQAARRIEIDAVTRLRAALGITSEWVYYGNMAQLPAELIEKMQLEIRASQREKRS